MKIAGTLQKPAEDPKPQPKPETAEVVHKELPSQEGLTAKQKKNQKKKQQRKKKKQLANAGEKDSDSDES